MMQVPRSGQPGIRKSAGEVRQTGGRCGVSEKILCKRGENVGN